MSKETLDNKRMQCIGSFTNFEEAILTFDQLDLVIKPPKSKQNLH